MEGRVDRDRNLQVAAGNASQGRIVVENGR